MVESSRKPRRPARREVIKESVTPMEIHDKKQLAAICIERLKKEYPLSDCTLDYEHAWQLLVEVRLAAQCTDARVNVVVQDLFAKYPNVAALAGRGTGGN